MTAREIVVRVVDALDAVPISYMLTGALAAGAYGVSRATKDADFVIQLAESQNRQSLIASLGTPFRLDPQIHFESITGSTCHRIHVSGSRFFVEQFLLGSDAFAQERFCRRRSMNLFDRQVSLPPLEDIVIQKLRWWRQGGRGKERDDAAEVISSMGTKLDWSYIRDWCSKHGTLELLDKLRAFPD